MAKAWEGVDMQGTYPVVSAHVHVYPLEPDTCRIQVKVHTPESRAEGVGEPRSSLVVERVGLAKDEWWSSRIDSFDLVIFYNMGVDRSLGHGMVHQRPLEGNPWGSCATDVTITDIGRQKDQHTLEDFTDSLVRSKQLNVLVLVESFTPRFRCLQFVPHAGERRSNVPVGTILGHVRTVLLEKLVDLSRAVEPLVDVLCLVPTRRSHRALGRGRE